MFKQRVFTHKNLAHSRSLGILLMIAIVMICASNSFASPNSGITYQGRILKPDGTSLEGANVQFKLQVRTPGAESCLMFEEVQALDMRNSSGSFSLTINDGSGARTDTSGFSIDRVFANRLKYVFNPSACASGDEYTPNSADGRKLVVSFKDETMATWEPMPAQNINFVPLAIEAKQIQGFNARSLLRVQDSDGTLGNFSPLSNDEYDELLALVAGTSTQFTKANELNGKPLPTLAAGQVLGWNGTTWVATTAATGSSTSTILKDPDASTNTGITFQASPNIAADYTITWPATAGASGQVLTTNGFGVMGWVTPLTATTGFVQGGNAFAAAANLGTTDAQPLNLVTGGTAKMTVLADGKVGIGTATPAYNLDVQGGDINTSNKFRIGGAFAVAAPEADSIILGNTAAASVATGSRNTVVGRSAMDALTTGGQNVALGYEAMKATTDGSYNVGLGFQALNTSTSSGNTALGFGAMSGTTTANNNVVIGATAFAVAGASGSTNVIIGNNAMGSLTSGADNVSLGYGSGGGVTTGSQNISIGRGSGGNVGTGTKNIMIGHGIGAPLANTSYQLNIGNMLFGTGLTGAAGVGSIGIGVTAPSASLQIKAGSATVAPFKLTSSGAGVLLGTPQDGAMEYDGTNLSFTVGTTRKTVSLGGSSGNLDNVTSISNSTGNISITPSPVSTGSVTIGSTTASTTTGTGALIVNGGAGIAGNLNVGQAVSAVGVTSTAPIGTVSAVNANASNNYDSPSINLTSKYYNGSASTLDTWGLKNVLGTGTTPTSTLTIDHTAGSTGAKYVSFPTGNVGIGVAAPSFGLEVAGTSKFSSQMLLSGGSASTPALAFVNTSTGLYWPTTSQLGFVTNGAERMKIDQLGRIGIGEGSPQAALHVTNPATGVTTGQEVLRLSGNITAGTLGSGPTIQFTNNSNVTTGRIGAFSEGTNLAGLSFSTYNTTQSESMRITGTGKVGIGTAAPTAKLDVQGGSIRSVASTGISATNASSSAIDFSLSNNQTLTAPCTTTVFSNMPDGATYNLAVTDTTATTCTFSSTGLAFFFSPANGSRIAGLPTVYSFTRIGSNVFVSWTVMNPQ